MGRNHARSFHSHPDSKLVAVVDMNPERFEEFTPIVGPENCFSDYQEMLQKAKPDVVSIALPNSLHAPVTIDCLEAGAHVLCEKPMAMNVEQALQMRDAAAKTGKTLGINLSTRFGKGNQVLKELADEGVLGTPYHAFTRWTRADGIPGFGGWFGQKKLSGGGPLIDLGVHRIDVAAWLMGSPKPLTVSGMAHSLLGVPLAREQGKAFDVEDYASGFVRFEGNISMVFEVSWAGFQAEKEQIAFRVMGTEGGFKQGYLPGAKESDTYYVFRKAGRMMVSHLVTPPSEKPNSYEAFVNAIRDNTPYAATAEDGIKIQMILDALYESSERGHEVEVKHLGEL